MIANQVPGSNSVKAKRGRRRDGNKDYHGPNLLTNNSFIEIQTKALKYYSLNWPALRDLILIYNHFKEYNSGINANGIIKAYNNSDGTFRALFARLSLLQKKELIRSENRRYYPTDKAITELQSFS